MGASRSEGAASTDLRRVGVGAFAVTLGTTVFSQGFLVIQGLLLARLLGPAGRGELVTVMVWPILIGGLGTFGLSFVIARVAANGQDPGRLTRTALVCAIGTAGVAMGVGYVVMPWLLPAGDIHLLPLARMFLWYILIDNVRQYLWAVNRGRGHFGKMNLCQGLINPGIVIGLFVLFFADLGEVRWAVVVLLCGQGLTTVVTLALAWRDTPLIGPMADFRPLLRATPPFGLAKITDELYAHIDKILLVWLLPPELRGFYVVALSAASVTRTIYGRSGFVAFSMTAQEGNGSGFAMVAALFRRLFWVWLAVAGTLAALLPLLIPLVYGQEFAPAIGPALLLLVGTGFAGMATLLDQCLRGQGRPLVSLAARGGSVVATAVAAYALAQPFGVVGMAGAYTIAQGVCLLIVASIAVRHYQGAHAGQLRPRLRDIRELYNSIHRRVMTRIKRGKTLKVDGMM